LADATAKWSTGTYSIGRLVVGTERRGGRALMEVLRKYWNWKRRGDPPDDQQSLEYDAAESEAVPTPESVG
jgi:hypothetical protein